MNKVIFIEPDYNSQGGVTRVTHLIANELINSGLFDIEIVSLSKIKGTPYYALHPCIKTKSISTPKFDLKKDFLIAAIQLKKIYEEDPEAIFIVDDIGITSIVYFSYMSFKKSKFICWTHTNFFNGSFLGFSTLGKLTVKFFYDGLIALTKEDYLYYKNILKLDKLAQIYNPTNPNVKKCIYNVDSKKIISVGRLSKEKGFDHLIKVGNLVLNRFTDWVWDIYGDGPEKSHLQNLIDEYNLTDRIILKGYSKNILSVYNEYSLCVFTSQNEGCPLAMIESIQSGLPIVSFDFKCGPKDLIINGSNGFIVESFNERKMANKIIELIINKNLRVSFSKRTSFVLKELNLNLVINKWINLLSQLIS